MSKFGIDVSAHNGIIDWNKAKEHIQFAILKLGNIGDNKKFWKDDSFERNYTECTRLGIPIGVYVYSYTNETNNVEQAGREVVSYLNGRHLDLPVFIDMEDKEIAPEGKEKLTDMCIKFNTIIENAGYKAGVYANLNWYNNYLNKDILKEKYVTWIATYRAGTDIYKGEYDIWQNSSKGRIDGINGNVDTNYMYSDIIKVPEAPKVEEVKEIEGSDEPVRRYKNGSTREDVYADTNLTNKIGSLNPYEECDCFGIFNDRPMVRYRVNGTNNYKIGFAKWKNGVK